MKFRFEYKGNVIEIELNKELAKRYENKPNDVQDVLQMFLTTAFSHLYVHPLAQRRLNSLEATIINNRAEICRAYDGIPLDVGLELLDEEDEDSN